MSRFNILAVWFIAGLFILSSCTHQTPPPAAVSRPSNARDAAAEADAENGWYANALKTRSDRLTWWREARFGCFIHWGAYAVPAGEWNGKATGAYSEHIMRQARIPVDVYKTDVVGKFDPEQFNAQDWVKLIGGAGMKYVVITAKHHDGFAMWPCDCYKYDIRDNTPFKRDPMAELSAACHTAGIHFGFYYSHALDWEHPDAPGNDWDYQNPTGDKNLFGPDPYNTHPELRDHVGLYVDQKAIPQIKELISKYRPDIFWFDVGGHLPLEYQLKVVKSVRLADANVVVNGRAARDGPKNFGDYVDTSDNPVEIRPTAGDWECIPTCNQSWGYNKLDHDFRTPASLIQLLAKTSAKGGNMLLNIGPRGDGTIDPNQAAILEGIGKWMAVNSESIYGTQRTPLDRQAWGDSTVKDNKIYLHVFDWPADHRLIVGGLQANVSSAHLLADASAAQLKVETLGHDLVVDLPDSPSDPVDSVVVLETSGDIQTTPGYLLALNIPDNRLLAYDAQMQGSFRYGDGKRANYWVAGLAKAADSITWHTRLNAPADFDVSIVYSAEQPGTVNVALGDHKAAFPFEATGGVKNMQTLSMGRIHLEPGAHDLVLQNPMDSDHDLMNVFEIHLKPAG